jgi:hypothetical protein
MGLSTHLHITQMGVGPPGGQRSTPNLDQFFDRSSGRQLVSDLIRSGRASVLVASGPRGASQNYIKILREAFA